MHRNYSFIRKPAANHSEYAARWHEHSLLLQEENVYERLLAQGYSKREIHSALHKYILAEIQYTKATGYTHTALHQKPSLFSKVSHFLKSLVSAMVSLIKTQFAKKPKNPV